MMPVKKLVSVTGHMSWIASVAPVATPFASMLWEALTDDTQWTPKRNTTRKRPEKLVFVKILTLLDGFARCSLGRVHFGEHSL